MAVHITNADKLCTIKYVVCFYCVYLLFLSYYFKLTLYTAPIRRYKFIVT